jgi:hypothetical protein
MKNLENAVRFVVSGDDAFSYDQQRKRLQFAPERDASLRLLERCTANTVIGALDSTLCLELI